MHILTAITSYPPAIGGAQIHTHQIMRQLATRHQVQVASFWHQHRTDWLLGTTLLAPLHALDYQQDGIPVKQITLNMAQRFTIWPWVASYYLRKEAAIKRIAALLAPKIDQMLPQIDLVHCARIGREPLAWAAYQVARARRVPFILAPYHHPRWVGWNYRALHQLYRAADGVLALTDHERNQLLELGLEPERIFVVGAAPNLHACPKPEVFRQRYGLGEYPIILFLAQKLSYKGWDQLLRVAPSVWQKHPEARFVFIGPRTKQSRRRFRTIKDPRIVELGSVDEQEKADALAACTLFCLPSNQESFGMVYAEAWSMGRPVIGLDIPALRDVISDGVDGFRVALGDDAALAERITLLLAYPSLATELGQRGQEKVQKHYSWERVTAACEAAYQQVTALPRNRHHLALV